jgi:hypothetical protein
LIEVLGEVGFYAAASSPAGGGITSTGHLPGANDIDFLLPYE